MATPRALVFDLGGVLVDAVGLSELPRLLPAPLEPKEVRRRWLASPAVTRFESGLCSGDDFAALFIEEWQLRIEPAALLEEVRGWVRAPYPGTPELLAALRGRYTLACLSNTNALHWQKMSGMEGMGGAFDRQYLSHELGVMKPNPEIFRRVVADIGHAADAIAFFDDGPENVAAARAVGLDAHLTVGPEDLRRTLSRQGLL
jgi:putative hydrolase of the HAD superfamily